MSVSLRSIISKNDKLEGKKSSEIVDGSTGNDPGVDYSSRAEVERDFVKKHKVEKNDDRVGNDEKLYNASNVDYTLNKEINKRRGNTKKEAEDVYEAKEEKCNNTEEGIDCYVHGKKSCNEKEEKIKRALGTKYSSR